MKKSAEQVVPEEPAIGLFHTDEEQAKYFAREAKVVVVHINIVGREGAARILARPWSATPRKKVDGVIWRAGANCGEWTVTFKDEEEPLLPPGPYRSSGPIGGEATGRVSFYRYAIEAVDARDGTRLYLDPDVVIIPGF